MSTISAPVATLESMPQQEMLNPGDMHAVNLMGLANDSVATMSEAQYAGELPSTDMMLPQPILNQANILKSGATVTIKQNQVNENAQFEPTTEDAAGIVAVGLCCVAETCRTGGACPLKKSTPNGNEAGNGILTAFSARFQAVNELQAVAQQNGIEFDPNSPEVQAEIKRRTLEIKELAKQQQENSTTASPAVDLNTSDINKVESVTSKTVSREVTSSTPEPAAATRSQPAEVATKVEIVETVEPKQPKPEPTVVNIAPPLPIVESRPTLTVPAASTEATREPPSPEIIKPQATEPVMATPEERVPIKSKIEVAVMPADVIPKEPPEQLRAIPRVDVPITQPDRRTSKTGVDRPKSLKNLKKSPIVSSQVREIDLPPPVLRADDDENNKLNLKPAKKTEKPKVERRPDRQKIPIVQPQPPKEQAPRKPTRVQPSAPAEHPQRYKKLEMPQPPSKIVKNTPRPTPGERINVSIKPPAMHSEVKTVTVPSDPSRTPPNTEILVENAFIAQAPSPEVQTGAIDITEPVQERTSELYVNINERRTSTSIRPPEESISVFSSEGDNITSSEIPVDQEPAIIFRSSHSTEPIQTEQSYSNQVLTTELSEQSNEPPISQPKIRTEQVEPAEDSNDVTPVDLKPVKDVDQNESVPESSPLVMMESDDSSDQSAKQVFDEAADTVDEPSESVNDITPAESVLEETEIVATPVNPEIEVAENSVPITTEQTITDDGAEELNINAEPVEPVAIILEKGVELPTEDKVAPPEKKLDSKLSNDEENEEQVLTIENDLILQDPTYVEEASTKSEEFIEVVPKNEDVAVKVVIPEQDLEPDQTDQEIFDFSVTISYPEVSREPENIFTYKSDIEEVIQEEVFVDEEFEEKNPVDLLSIIEIPDENILPVEPNNLEEIIQDDVPILTVDLNPAPIETTPEIETGITFQENEIIQEEVKPFKIIETTLTALPEVITEIIEKIETIPVAVFALEKPFRKETIIDDSEIQINSDELEPVTKETQFQDEAQVETAKEYALFALNAEQFSFFCTLSTDITEVLPFLSETFHKQTPTTVSDETMKLEVAPEKLKNDTFGHYDDSVILAVQYILQVFTILNQIHIFQ